MRQKRSWEVQVPENKIKLAPSILSADFSRLGEQVTDAVKAGADYIHIDVMDGHFVPNITVGPLVVTAVRRCTNVPLDVHLMIESPDRHIKSFADAGANIITVHIETCPHINRTVQFIKSLGIKAGVSLNPGTPAEMVSEILKAADLLLVMTVNPGFGGQAFIPETLDKIKRLRAEIDKLYLNTELEVDGGISSDTAPQVVNAGARVLVAGAAVFNSKHTVSEAIQKIRKSLSSS
jgi:ribulose-phosphate 3-epimerase